MVDYRTNKPPIVKKVKNILILLLYIFLTCHNTVYSSQTVLPLWLGMGGQYGIEKLKYKNDIVVPIPNNDELFIRVKGSGNKNSDVNNRIGVEI